MKDDQKGDDQVLASEEKIPTVEERWEKRQKGQQSSAKSLFLMFLGLMGMTVALALVMRFISDRLGLYSQKDDLMSTFTIRKPVLYLYPTEETDVNVIIPEGHEVLTSYPMYENGWEVTATSDGVLTDAEGRRYPYLYWDESTLLPKTLETAYNVSASEVGVFLDDHLIKCGLSETERADFITYWLPKMSEYKHLAISFVYKPIAEITPKPNTHYGIYVLWRGGNFLPFTYEEPSETIPVLNRNGYYALEWGGAQIQ